MKILHTADWHLGKRLDNFSRMEEQRNAMDEIVAIADAESVDMVLVAGDLFDSFNPPVEAVDLFYKTLKRLSKDGLRPVVAIAGNHDSPSLIDAPDPLAKACGIILIGQPNAIVTPFALDNFEITKTDKGFLELKLKNIAFPIRLLHTAYANEQRLKENLGENKEEYLNEILANNWKTIAEQYCDAEGVNILTAHLYMNKKGSHLIEEPDGEKPIKIGNADMVYSASIPEQIQYTALGHIHGFSNIGTDEKPVVYASSPIAYSFSETGQKKYVSIVSIIPNENASYEKVALQSGRALYRKTFDNVDDAVNWLSEHPYALVELTLESETFLKAEDRKRIYQAHDGIIYLIPKLTLDKGEVAANPQDINLSQDIVPLFIDYFKSKNAGQAPNEDLMNLFNEIKNA